MARSNNSRLVLIACSLSLVSIGATIIEKRWTEHSPTRMMEIARERVEVALKLADDPALELAASRVDWDPAAPDEWAPAVCDLVDLGFDLYPPREGHGDLRRGLFEVFDVVVHLDYPAGLVESMDRMYRKRVDRAIAEIASTKSVPGVRVWKLYNMGFVVMTEKHCLVFDLHPGRVVSELGDDRIKALAGRADMLFISHRHGDHWDQRVMEAFSDAGKPILSPEGDFWDGEGLTVVREARDEPLEFGGVKVWVYPGHQFLRCACSLYVVEADGITVSHNGDMSAPHPWVMGLRKRHEIDIQLLNCWAIPTYNARGQRAKMIVVGHEYELGHDINGRRGVDETSAMLNRKFLRHNLIWGESVNWPGPVK